MNNYFYSFEFCCLGKDIDAWEWLELIEHLGFISDEENQ